MSTTRKVLTIIFSILIIGAFAFILTWGIINWSRVKEGMSGSGLYTQDDIQSAYEDGYSTALADKEEYDKLINSYRDTITTQNDLISQYTSEANALNGTIKDYQNQVDVLNEQKAALETQIETLNTISSNNEATISELNGQIAALSNQVLVLQASKEDNARQIEQLNEQIAGLQSINAQLQQNNELNTNTINALNTQIVSLNNQIAELNLQMQNNSSTVNVLNNKIAELQKSVSYYEQYIATLESGEQVVATFEFDGSVYNIQVVAKNSLLTVTEPTSTAYVIFNGWTVDGQAIDLSTYRITQNTKIVADVTYKYEVNFIVDGANYSSQIVLKDSAVTVPVNPTKSGYVFDGWTIDGNSVVNLTDYTVTQNVTFTAKFTTLYSVIFKYEETTLKSETVKSGECATAPTPSDTAYKIFNGWKVNGVLISVSDYRITADTVFIADITYKYDVKFITEGITYNTQIVEKYGKATVPGNPTKENYVFSGWAVDGNIVDVSQYVITEDTTFTAVFTIQTFTVTFKNGDTKVSTQEIEYGGYATEPKNPTKADCVFIGWSLDGYNTVEISATAITSDTIFIALFETADRTVNIIYDGATVETQQVSYGGYVTVAYSFPTHFYNEVRYTVNGNAINLSTYAVTENVDIVATVGVRGGIYSKSYELITDWETLKSEGAITVTDGCLTELGAYFNVNYGNKSNPIVFVMSDELTSVERNVFKDFYYCFYGIVVPGTIENYVDSCMENIKNLEFVIFLDGVKTIDVGDGAAKYVYIPQSVTTLGYGCFDNKAGICYIYFQSTSFKWDISDYECEEDIYVLKGYSLNNFLGIIGAQ